MVTIPFASYVPKSGIPVGTCAKSTEVRVRTTRRQRNINATKRAIGSSVTVQFPPQKTVARKLHGHGCGNQAKTERQFNEKRSEVPKWKGDYVVGWTIIR